MKYCVSIMLGAVLLYAVCFAGEKPELKEEKSRVNYSVGYQIGGDFKRQGVELSPEMLVKGIQNAVPGADPLMTPQEMNKTLVEPKRKIIASQREERKEAVEKNRIEGSEPTVAEEAATIPGAPAALRLKIVQNGFELSWTLSPHDPGTVTGYEIVRSANIFSGPYAAVATVGKGISQYIDTTALPENIYYYKVRAIAGKAYSPFSNTVTGER